MEKYHDKSAEIRVLIVEDNPITSQDLKEILIESGFQVTGIAKNKDKALELIEQDEPDLLLVDINLTFEEEGIDLVKEVQQSLPIPFIFLTAYSDKKIVDKALRTKPAAYLTKPYDERDVIIAAELAFLNHTSQLFTETSSKQNSFIFLKDGDIFEKVDLTKILYLQAEGSYTKFITDKKILTLSGNLNSMLTKINNDSFVRIHRSYIVNTQNVTGLDYTRVFIGDTALPIGRNYKEATNLALQKIS